MERALHERSDRRTSFSDAIASFLSSLSIASLDIYKSDLVLFKDFMNLKGKEWIEDVSREDLEQYVDHMLRHYRVSSVTRKVSVLRRFCRFCRDAYGSEVFPGWDEALGIVLKADMNGVGFGMRGEFEREVGGLLLEEREGDGNILAVRRHYSVVLGEIQERLVSGDFVSELPEMVMLGLYWESGLSLQEVIRLPISSIRDHGGLLTVYFRRMEVYPGWEWWEAFRQYVQRRWKGGGAFLFMSDEEVAQKRYGVGRSRAKRWIRQMMERGGRGGGVEIGIRDIRVLRRYELGSWVMPLRRQVLSTILGGLSRVNTDGELLSAMAFIAFSGYPEMALRSRQWVIDVKSMRRGESEIVIGKCKDGTAEVEARSYFPLEWFRGQSLEKIEDALREQRWRELSKHGRWWAEVLPRRGRREKA